MGVLRAIVFSAALAGLIVGVVVTAVQHLGTVPLILKGEVYEDAAEKAEQAKAPAAAEHHHEAEAWQPAEGFERNAYTALFNIIDWIGFALMLIGAIVIAGRPAGWREGFLWGLGGFAVFVLAPSFGLPPELPGVPAAPLEPRQIWWVATAAATAAGLGLVAFSRSPFAALAAVVLFAAPHLVGAPRLAELETNVPESLSHAFVVAVLLTTLVSWTLLGALGGYFYGRFSREAPARSLA